MPREISSKTFKIKFGDTSLGVLNDRETYNRYYSWVMSPHTWNSDGSLKTTPTSGNTGGTLIETPFMDWHYWPEKMWNIIVRELILDTEAVIQSHVRITAMSLNPEIFERVKHVIENPPKNTSGFIFNALPGAIHDNCKLRCYSKVNWKKIDAFYNEVRNNLMHWKQISNGCKDVIQEVFSLYRDIYLWIYHISVDMNFYPSSDQSVLFDCFPDRWGKTMRK